MNLLNKVLSVSLFIIALLHAAYGQELRGFVFDTISGDPMPFTTIYNLSTKEGTLCDENGFFKINRTSLDDQIQISFVGYHTKKIVTGSTSAHFYLKPRRQNLNTLLVLGDNMLAYAMVSKLAENEPKEQRVSKAYYGLQTEKGNTPVEFIESYYSAHSTGYKVDDLELKNGRIAFNSASNEYSFNTSTSQVFGLFETSKRNYYFPQSPLSLSKSKLKKKYDLKIISRYEENERVFYYISCKAKEDGYFNADLWIDSIARRPIKMEFYKEDCIDHPFYPIMVDTIKRVDLSIVKQFSGFGDEYRMDYNMVHYDIEYKRAEGTIVDLSTTALLGFYDYGEPFNPILFEFDEFRDEDYRQINAIPYDTVFWNNYTDYRKGNPMSIDETWFNSDDALLQEDFLQPSAKFAKVALAHRYVRWRPNQRVIIRDTRDLKEQLTQKLPIDKYNLEGQILLNTYPLEDTLAYASAAIFDPYNTFYNDEMTPAALAFINMYFDLIEIHHRRLLISLKQASNYEEAKAYYNQQSAKLKDECNSFIRDVDRGTNEAYMKTWNDYIRSELQIDNIASYGLTFE